MNTLIIFLLILMALEITKKEKELRKKKKENRELLSEIFKTKDIVKKEKYAIDYFFKLMSNETMLENECNVGYFQNKENGYYISVLDILKYSFLLKEIDLCKLKKSNGIIVLDNKAYYLPLDETIDNMLLGELLKGWRDIK